MPKRGEWDNLKAEFYRLLSEGMKVPAIHKYYKDRGETVGMSTLYNWAKLAPPSAMPVDPDTEETELHKIRKALWFWADNPTTPGATVAVSALNGLMRLLDTEYGKIRPYEAEQRALHGEDDEGMMIVVEVVDPVAADAE